MEVKKTQIKKSKIALIQLRRAIQLYNSGDFISSLTLAGASNEIFGQFALLHQGYNTLDGEKHFWDGIAKIYRKSKPSKEKIKKVNNRIKNELKHHDVINDEIVSADFQFEAECHINNAIRNYWIAFDHTPKDRIINRYVEKEWA